MSTFDAKLKAIRLSRELSQDEMGKVVAQPKQQISRYETGQTSPRLDTLRDMAERLDIDLILLIDDSYSVDDVLDYQKSRHFYTNPETEAIAQEIYNDKDLRLLFDAAKDAAPEDLKLVQGMLKALKDKEQKDDR